MPDTSRTPSFPDRLANAAGAAAIIGDFELLLEDQFAALTRQGKITDTRGRKPDPITDMDPRTNGGGEGWGLSKWWERSLDLVNIDTDTVTFEHRVAGDHGHATVVEYAVPWALLAVDPEADEQYQEYLRLKAIYGPTHQ